VKGGEDEQHTEKSPEVEKMLKSRFKRGRSDDSSRVDEINFSKIIKI
jgi:hypothetical protein